MAAYLKANGNIKYCPKCSIRTERISGCAKMKCVRCEISWCWNCRAECSYNHFKRDKSFEVFNPTGWLRCPGYYKTENRCWMISKEIMLLLFLPVYLLLQPTCVVIAHSFDKNVKGIGSFIFWFLCSLWFAIIVGLIISLFFFYISIITGYIMIPIRIVRLCCAKSEKSYCAVGCCNKGNTC